ncbi:MAG: glutaminyl-peptide cyclotransferase [Flavobacteriales bacterium]|nr:glutaminyl-peptide cyclotransferase [Flavobacteriales bacterium]
MRPIVKIGAGIIALAMISLLFLNPSGCTSDTPDRRPLAKPKQCFIRSESGSIQSGQPIRFRSGIKVEKTVLDSTVTLDGIPVMEEEIPTDELLLGRHDLKIRYLFDDSTRCESSWSIEILSDVTPQVMQYQVISMYDHNTDAYTQGLTWHDGRIYESTGQHGESLIYNYDPMKRDYADRVDLPMTYFGEGLTILGDRIYQLTYKSKLGFYYDLNTMEKLGEFSLPTAEGWGLTDNGRELIISDGTHVLTVLDPKTFEVLRTIPVYDDKQRLESINEMEYVDGYIYANLYGATVIAKIDASSGKVLEYIDCRGILPPELQTPDQDVFNGIAYNSERRTFYVTGKYWPKLFEVSFVPRPS